MTAGTVAEVAGTYFEAWKAGDFERVRSILADDVTFDGPLGRAGKPGQGRLRVSGRPDGAW